MQMEGSWECLKLGRFWQFDVERLNSEHLRIRLATSHHVIAVATATLLLLLHSAKLLQLLHSAALLAFAVRLLPRTLPLASVFQHGCQQCVASDIAAISLSYPL